MYVLRCEQGPSQHLPALAGAEGQVCGEHSCSPHYDGPGRRDSSVLDYCVLPLYLNNICFQLLSPYSTNNTLGSSFIIIPPFSCSFSGPFTCHLLSSPSYQSPPATHHWLCNSLLGESPSPHPPPGLPLLHPAVPPTCCVAGDQGQDQREGPTCCHPIYVCPNPH